MAATRTGSVLRGGRLRLVWRGRGCRTGTSVVRSDDARAREEEVAAVIGRAIPWSDPVRQLKAARTGRIREAHELGHRVAHRLPAQPRTNICARGEESGPLAAIRGAGLYVDDSIARPPGKPGDAAARAHIVHVTHWNTTCSHQSPLTPHSRMWARPLLRLPVRMRFP